MAENFPKAVRAEQGAHVLKVYFADGSVRYLLDHTAKADQDFWTKKGGMTIKNALATRNGWWAWMGNEITVNADGAIVVNGRDVYPPAEIAANSRETVAGLYHQRS
ncbi:hypothetical protein [Lacticaseibacillus sharpeae]|uniref:Uncharacterized protein n=1 Tax=Lacticaseibacillus sharpeae JCM 1186 = DSM 20505 TaxID=1291052 RepID=A0A0R1ZM35_9LACO|nr:hypothetical protein [Lacticaseibacillus sharpeae]KRM55599.1 hypothetical protein FC18_GL001217 [Lacticaseibacillus sharpeae JCM 1186 = DSM 20505]